MHNLIFDYDGTLHESIYIYEPAFRKAYAYLLEQGLAKKQSYSTNEISRFLGLSARDMWKQFMPELKENERQFCSDMIGEEMLRLTKNGSARLYPKTPTMLNECKKAGHRLIFLSNCKCSYMETHREYFGLDRYFDAFYCTEAYHNIPKHEIFNEIKKAFDGEFIIIGDRYVDVEIAAFHKLPSIGCCYGYGAPGELDNATRQVADVSEILDTVNQLILE